MAVTREVILDLLPLYLSDEASADSRTLVKEHLEIDPELERLATEWKVPLHTLATSEDSTMWRTRLIISPAARRVKVRRRIRSARTPWLIR